MKTISAAVALLAACSTLASADSMIRRRAESSGYRGMGAFESESLRKIQGVKARDEGTFKFTGAILGRLSKKKGTVDVLRVDLDKRWTLDPKKKTYTEASISQPPAEEKEAVEQEERREEKEKSKPTHRIKKTSFDVNKTADKKKINGFETQRYEAVFTLEVEEIETKAVTTYKMVSDQWLTPWTKSLRKASEEEVSFAKAYAKRAGLDVTPQEKASMGIAAVQMMTQAAGPELKKTLTDMSAKLAKLDGFAVRSETRWLTEAPKVAAKTKVETKKKADEDEDEIDVSNGVGGFLGGLAKSAAKKKVKKAAEERAAAQDGKPAFSSTMEVLAVSDDSLGKDEFEIPEGYKKKG